MKCTLRFRLNGGMDSLMRVIGLLRRKGIIAEDLSFHGQILELSVREEEFATAVSNIRKLADVQSCA